MLLTLVLVPVPAIAQPLVLLVQPPVWADQAARFDAQPFAWHLSRVLGRTVAVQREPAGESYRSVTTAGRGDALRPEALPDVELPVADLFGSRAIP